MSISDFNRDGVRFINNGDVIYNGKARTRWEARLPTHDGKSTYTDAHFLAPERATRAEVEQAYHQLEVVDA